MEIDQYMTKVIFQSNLFPMFVHVLLLRPAVTCHTEKKPFEFPKAIVLNLLSALCRFKLVISPDSMYTPAIVSEG